MSEKVGLWIIGAFGGVATTLAVGLRALARGLVQPIGLVTETEEFRALRMVGFADLVIGGCDLRSTTLERSAREIEQANHSLPVPLIDAVAPDLGEIDASISRGVRCNSGAAVERIAPDSGSETHETLRAAIARIQGDLAQFQARHRLARIVVVNLSSTEPMLAPSPTHESLDALEAALDANDASAIRASVLYSYAAIASGCAFLNFTPAHGALIPALVEFARRRNVPLCGSDGKTGETLVKSVLAPMFRARQLRVLTWQGYNILGDRDGEVLSDKTHLEAKVKSKDKALASILGYPLHTHVGIDFVPSLHDLKTAWDFIHFEGFLGHRMAMQFIWQGCDSILAAPLVLDLARLLDVSLRTGRGGPQRHLASFFKSPLECDEHDFREQFGWLIDFALELSSEIGTGDSSA